MVRTHHLPPPVEITPDQHGCGQGLILPGSGGIRPDPGVCGCSWLSFRLGTPTSPVCRFVGTHLKPRPIRIAIPDSVLGDLARRLAVARLPPPQSMPDGEPGDPAGEDDEVIDRIAGLLAYWRDGYDWRAQERRINAVPQFRATVDGVGTALIRRSRSEEHTSELQSRQYLVCRLLLEKKKKTTRVYAACVRAREHMSDV